KASNEQDERVTVRNVADTSQYDAVRTAATTALAGDATQVHAFLQTGRYTAALSDYRIKVSQLIETGGPRVQAAAKAALETNTPDSILTVLNRDQYTAKASDDRVTASQLIETGGDEVKNRRASRPRRPLPRPHRLPDHRPVPGPAAGQAHRGAQRLHRQRHRRRPAGRRPRPAERRLRRPGCSRRRRRRRPGQQRRRPGRRLRPAGQGRRRQCERVREQGRRVRRDRPRRPGPGRPGRGIRPELGLLRPGERRSRTCLRQHRLRRGHRRPPVRRERRLEQRQGPCHRRQGSGRSDRRAADAAVHRAETGAGRGRSPEVGHPGRQQAERVELVRHVLLARPRRSRPGELLPRHRLARRRDQLRLVRRGMVRRLRQRRGFRALLPQHHPLRTPVPCRGQVRQGRGNPPQVGHEARRDQRRHQQVGRQQDRQDTRRSAAAG
ncbi:ALF repeat-containing protein, partial [Kitasatospora sp. NPDC093558]|uniref:ALF repeat-containing protein n=1 Tax=Kitasatospora sp. NPDC093558 TaxID=3155201 RepID=UPI003422918E